jgi:large subunit ribosomal protein L5
MSTDSQKYEPRMKQAHREAVTPAMMKKRGWTNAFQVPLPRKVVINIGLSEARENAKVVDLASAELGALAGQKPEVRRAKKAISNFKLREGMPIGVRVTLRGARMWEFLDRLINMAIPRIRDFQGLDSRRGFDGRGNFNLGLTEQYVFPEIDLDKSDKARGMNITIVTDAGRDDAAREMLGLLGMPFKKPKADEPRAPAKAAEAAAPPVG